MFYNLPIPDPLSDYGEALNILKSIDVKDECIEKLSKRISELEKEIYDLKKMLDFFRSYIKLKGLKWDFVEFAKMRIDEDESKIRTRFKL